MLETFIRQRVRVWDLGWMEREMGIYELSVGSSFSAAHHLARYEGKCALVHGHNWNVEIVVRSEELNEAGMVGDFGVFRSELEAVTGRLDHTDLNENEFMGGLNPTCENVAARIYQELVLRINDERCRLAQVSVWEKSGSSVTYRAEE